MAFVTPPGATLIRELGSGSTFEVAWVCIGHDEALCKRVALRSSSADLGLKALQREATVLEHLTHPAVPKLLERGEDHRGPFLLQSPIAGRSIRHWVDDGNRLATAAVRTAFSHLGDLHERGFSHGDIGPDHVLVDGERVGFVDFGQARWRGFEGAAGERGTLPYVAPELARGECAPDAACDTFALAATFAFFILGRAPCKNDAAGMLLEAAEVGVERQAIALCDRPAGKLPPTVTAVLMDALQFDRKQRLTDAGAVARALDDAMHE